MTSKQKLVYERSKVMAEKKSRTNDAKKKKRPSVSNDQLGENAGEGRFEMYVKEKNSKGK
jgi:hypothetical protein